MLPCEEEANLLCEPTAAPRQFLCTIETFVELFVVVRRTKPLPFACVKLETLRVWEETKPLMLFLLPLELVAMGEVKRAHPAPF